MVESDISDTILFAFKLRTKPCFPSHPRNEAAGENSKSLFSQEKAAFSIFKTAATAFSLLKEMI